MMTVEDRQYDLPRGQGGLSISQTQVDPKKV